MTNKLQKKPLISVYMPTKNRGVLLIKAIESVLEQDYPNFELIIVDDGSTDDTPKLLSQYASEYSKVRFFRNEQSIGAAAARNIAIKNAKGEFITGLDDDDLFCKDRLSSLYKHYDDKYAFICSSVIWDFGTRQKVADKKMQVFNLEQQLSYNHATTQVLVKTSRILETGGFDESFVARQDYDAWTCLMIKYGNALRIAHPSYILKRNDGLERITNSDSNIKGNHQFLQKHKPLMNKANLRNQDFWDIYAQGKRLTFIELGKLLFCGNVLMKLKYFIRSNFLK